MAAYQQDRTHGFLRDDHETQRQALRSQLESRFAQIFEKYEKDFTGIGDEIDLETGHVIVDNGHLFHMRNEYSAIPGNSEKSLRGGELGDECNVCDNASDNDSVVGDPVKIKSKSTTIESGDHTDEAALINEQSKQTVHLNLPLDDKLESLESKTMETESCCNQTWLFQGPPTMDVSNISIWEENQAENINYKRRIQDREPWTAYNNALLLRLRVVEKLSFPQLVACFPGWNAAGIRAHFVTLQSQRTMKSKVHAKFAAFPDARLMDRLPKTSKSSKNEHFPSTTVLSQVLSNTVSSERRANRPVTVVLENEVESSSTRSLGAKDARKPEEVQVASSLHPESLQHRDYTVSKRPFGQPYGSKILNGDQRCTKGSLSNYRLGGQVKMIMDNEKPASDPSTDQQQQNLSRDCLSCHEIYSKQIDHSMDNLSTTDFDGTLVVNRTGIEVRNAVGLKVSVDKRWRSRGTSTTTQMFLGESPNIQRVLTTKYKKVQSGKTQMDLPSLDLSKLRQSRAVQRKIYKQTHATSRIQISQGDYKSMEMLSSLTPAELSTSVPVDFQSSSPETDFSAVVSTLDQQASGHQVAECKRTKVGENDKTASSHITNDISGSKQYDTRTTRMSLITLEPDENDDQTGLIFMQGTRNQRKRDASCLKEKIPSRGTSVCTGSKSQCGRIYCFHCASTSR